MQIPVNSAATENGDQQQAEELPYSYPPKPYPEVKPRANQSMRFIISILLFGAFYYFFVSRNIEIIIWLAVIVLIHELGHYFAMKIFKYQDLSIFFIPLVGAVAEGSKETISQREKAIVLLAGPVPGIIIGLALYFLVPYFDHYLIVRLSYAFVLINILNLLPIYPLDGGQLLKTLFLDSKQIISNIFIIASVILITVYAILKAEWFLLIVPYFLVMRLVQERQLNRIRKELDEKGVGYTKPYGELTDAEYWQIRDLVLSLNSSLATKVLSNGHTVPENENEVISYISSVLKNKPVKDLSRAGIVLFFLLWIAAVAVPILLMAIKPGL